MASSLSSVPHIIIMFAEFVTGIAINGFLIIFNCYESIKSRKLAPAQLLFVCIGMSRFGLQMVLMVQSFFSILFPHFYGTKIYGAAMMFLWMFFSSVSLCFATCLSVFYCLKIADFTQSCFLWLKFRISTLMSLLLLGSLLASMSIAALCINVDYPKGVIQNLLGNATLNRTKLKMKKTSEVLLVNLMLIIPLIIFVMCMFMLFVSLYKHTHRMQNGSHGIKNASTKAHINALRTVVTFFCFFIIYFAAFMINITFSISYRSHGFFVVKDIMAAYPCGHSVIIIRSNSKFWQPFRRLLCFKRNR